jgi:hypothetical protein
VPPPDKTCRSCGRRITWRKKWERTWDDLRFCSDACRRRGVSKQDEQVEARIRSLLADARQSMTDVEVAGQLAPTQAGSPEAGQPTGVPIEVVRRAARRLVAAGVLEMVQRGRVVDPSTAAGPVLLRRRPGQG